MNKYLSRKLPPPSNKAILTAGLGGAIGIAVLALASELANVALIMAPFGASCVLLFAVPASPLSQPINVVGGHFLAGLVALILCAILPVAWWSAALAVGLAIGLMVALRVTHPPAGATPLVIFALTPGFAFLVFPVVLGAIALVLIAAAFHRATGTKYPLD